MELHRRDAFLLAHSKHAVERHTGRFLIPAIDRLERYLHVAEELTDWQSMHFWVEGILAEEAAAHASNRRRSLLPSSARTKARAQARARFEQIAGKVLEKLEAALSHTTPPPRRQPEPRCGAITRQGTRCKNPADESGLCTLHSTLTEDPALVRELLPDPQSVPESEPVAR